jgi:hypothetical protein
VIGLYVPLKERPPGVGRRCGNFVLILVDRQDEIVPVGMTLSSLQQSRGCCRIGPTPSAHPTDLRKGLTSMYLPKRELLSFLVVLALPKASMIGLLAKICLSVSLRFSESESFPVSGRRREEEAGREGSSTEAKYLRMNLADTVFPAPLRH